MRKLYLFLPDPLDTPRSWVSGTYRSEGRLLSIMAEFELPRVHHRHILLHPLFLRIPHT